LPKHQFMAAVYTYFKNSNTGHIVFRQSFVGISFKCPDYYYDINKQQIETVDLTGYVEISEKTFNRIAKKQKANTKNQ